MVHEPARIVAIDIADISRSLHPVPVQVPEPLYRPGGNDITGGVNQGSLPPPSPVAPVGSPTSNAPCRLVPVLDISRVAPPRSTPCTRPMSDEQLDKCALASPNDRARYSSHVKTIISCTTSPYDRNIIHRLVLTGTRDRIIQPPTMCRTIPAHGRDLGRERIQV
jgi:hypothetical protein